MNPSFDKLKELEERIKALEESTAPAVDWHRRYMSRVEKNRKPRAFLIGLIFAILAFMPIGLLLITRL